MLNVVSSGVARVTAHAYPAHLPLYVAIQLFIPASALNRLHSGCMSVKYNDGESIGRAEFAVSASGVDDLHPGEAVYFPAVIPLHPLPFHHTGEIDVNIDINGSHNGSVTFWLVDGASE